MNLWNPSAEVSGAEGYILVFNQWYEPRGKPLPRVPQWAAMNLPREIKESLPAYYEFPAVSEVPA